MEQQDAYTLIGTAGHARPGQAQVGSTRCDDGARNVLPPSSVMDSRRRRYSTPYFAYTSCSDAPFINSFRVIVSLPTRSFTNCNDL